MMSLLYFMPDFRMSEKPQIIEDCIIFRASQTPLSFMRGKTRAQQLKESERINKILLP